MRRLTRYLGRLALFLALVFMSLEMIRVRGWGLSQVEQLAAVMGLSAAELWVRVASISVAAAFGFLVIGLLAGGLSRSRLLEEADPEEEIDVAAVVQRIHSFEQFQIEQAGRGTQAIP